MQNWRQSPGLGSAMWRTWYSRSKFSSSTQYGSSSSERHAQQLAAEDRRAVQPALDVREDGLEAQLAAGRGALVVDLDEGDVGVGVARVRVEEARVVSAELAHGWVPVRIRCEVEWRGGARAARHQFVQRRQQRRRQLARIGHGAARGGEAEAHRAGIAHHGDVQPQAVLDDRQRPVGGHARAGRVQRHLRPGHVGDHDVGDRRHRAR